MKKNILIIICTFLFGCTDKKDTIIKNIKIGESKDSILKKLGKPDKSTVCDGNLWWGTKYLGKDVNKTCKSYFIYKGLFLKRYGIGFDEKEKVITKYTYVSE